MAGLPIATFACLITMAGVMNHANEILREQVRSHLPTNMPQQDADMAVESAMNKLHVKAIADDITIQGPTEAVTAFTEALADTMYTSGVGSFGASKSTVMALGGKGRAIHDVDPQTLRKLSMSLSPRTPNPATAGTRRPTAETGRTTGAKPHCQKSTGYRW